jgi:hypothetical protein
MISYRHQGALETLPKVREIYTIRSYGNEANFTPISPERAATMKK